MEELLELIKDKCIEFLKKVKDKVVYLLKQLLPFTYFSEYIDEDGQRKLSVFKMWFGKCFNIKYFDLKEVD